MEPLTDDFTAAEEWVAIRAAAPDASPTIELCALVLEARFVPARLETDGTNVALLVPAHLAETAARELRLYEEENRNWPPPPPPVAPRRSNPLAILSVLLLVATFYNVTLMNLPFPLDWEKVGAARAGRIADGEVWRAVTALTLHADYGHLLANLAIGGLLALLLAAETGGGVAWLVILLSGFLGNTTNALVQLREHTSIGSSTAVFGALGALTALGIVSHGRNSRRRWRIAIAGGVALLALLGTEGKNTDVAAHFFGFGWGLICGFAVNFVTARKGRIPPWAEVAAGTLTAAAVVCAWWVAFAVAR